MHAELPFSSARLNNAGNELETLPHAAVASHRDLKNQRSEPQYPTPQDPASGPHAIHTLYIAIGPHVRQRTLCVQRSQKLTLREQVLRDGEYYTALLWSCQRFVFRYFSRAPPRTPDPPLDMPLELDLPTEGWPRAAGLYHRDYIILT